MNVTFLYHSGYAKAYPADVQRVCEGILKLLSVDTPLNSAFSLYLSRVYDALKPAASETFVPDLSLWDDLIYHGRALEGEI